MSRTALTSAVSLLGVWIAVAPASAAWQPHADSGVAIDVPSDWLVQPEDDTGLLVAENPDRSVAVVLWVPDDTWEGALAALDNQLETIIELPSLDHEPEDGVLNGMTAHRRSGIGTVAGETVQWSLTLVVADKPVIALTFGTPAAWSMHADSAAGVVATLRRLQLQ